MPRAAPDRVRRRMTRRYVVALAAIAIALTAAYALVHMVLQARAVDNREVNAAGRQRMLSQRIAKSALALRLGDGEAFAALDADVRHWAESHHALLEGDPTRGLPGLASPKAFVVLDSLTDEVDGVLTAVGDLDVALQSGDRVGVDRAVEAILAGELAFLPRMEHVVSVLEADAGRTITHPEAIAHGIYLFLLAVIALVGRYVFRPSVDSVVRAVERADEQSRLLRTVIDTIPDHIFVKDVEGRATLRNIASARALGFDDPEEAVGHTDAEIPAEVDGVGLGEVALSDDLRVIRTGEQILNKEERSAEGGWLLTTKTPLLDAEGGIVGLVGVARDVTEARATEAKFRGLVEYSVAGTAIIQDGQIVYANPRMAQIFGYEPGELTGSSALAIIHEDDHPTVLENIRRRIEGEVEVLTYAVRGRCKDGKTIHIELAGVAGEHAGRPAVIGTVMDVTEREEMERTLFHQAHHDDLTGLPNRALFATRLEVAVAESKGDGDFAVLFVDLDRFKAVNDTLGHSAGDRLLREVSARLRRVLRPQDTVARLGGDEFAILLTDLPDLGHVEGVAARILETLRAAVRIDGRDVFVGASVGIVTGRADHTSPDAVLGEADLAMYDAKAAGRNRFSVYSPEGHGPASQRFRLEVDLHHAVERGELRLAYQPIVRLTDGALTGFEALVRWEHPEFGLLTPDAFMGPAEESGNVTLIDRWVLREACRQLAEWEGQTGRVLSLNVNCTGRDLLDDGYTGDVRRIPAEEGVDPGRILLEITESLLVEDTDAVAAELRRLQDRGVRFCVDDFGTGYSTLSTLHTLPVDTIKVDRSFVGALDADDQSRRLVETVVSLGRLLHKSVVAEGIETTAHLAALRAMGCAYGQGYLFDRPLSPAAASALIAAESPPWQGFWADATALAA